MIEPTRRTFLKTTSLTIAFSLSPLASLAEQLSSSAVLPGSLNTNRMLDGWLRINADGTVTVFTGKVEFGQGILTALTQIVADELDVDVERIKVVSGRTDRTPNEGFTAGSRSIEDSGTALRMASAQARGILLRAASAELGEPIADLRISDGSITSVSGGSAVLTSYWKLTTGATLHLEASADTQFKPSSQHRLIGQSLKRLDIPAKVTGGEAFVQDMRLPGMVYGRVVRPSAPRARLLKVDEAAARQMPGVVTVLRDGNFLALAAQREEQAIAAARTLQDSAHWQEAADLPPSGAALFGFMKQQRAQDSVVSDIQGAAPAGAAVHTLEAEYTRPYVAHAAIGPSCAVAQWKGGKLDVWCHSQGVFPLRADLAEALKIPINNITVMHREGSGCYGHNGADDVALDAALLARALPGTPVKVQWMRADEFAWEPLGAPMVIKLKGSVDAAGKVTNWNNEVWTFTHIDRPSARNGCNLLAAWHVQSPLAPGPLRTGGSDRNAIPLYVFPRQKVVSHVLLESPIRTSALRALGAYANVFALESFMDELAGAAGIDPLEFRMRHLNDPRARAVIERVAGMAQWKRAAATPGLKSKDGTLKGRGLGFARYNNRAVYCAVIAEVSVDVNSGATRVERAWSAVDAGLVINPDGARNQIEGAIIQSISWTLYEAVRYDTNSMLTRRWQDYPILRFREVPVLEVELINHPDDQPMGVGEGAEGPTVAAVANAFAHATGRRIRDLPLTSERVLKVLA
jgi:nicotinate dehydrogenase subunit B